MKDRCEIGPQKAFGRRRFIGITALAGMSLAAGDAVRARAPEFYSWQGQALGADASIRIHHPDAKLARSLIGRSVAEVRRLEKVFSLYQADSALSALNRTGTLEGPPLDLVRMLSEAQKYAYITGGAFDITVQSLWRLYSDHFARKSAHPDGPTPKAIEDTLARVDYKAVSIASHRVAFEKANMAVTLNGIAQGYITDRIAELLRQAGLDNVLIDLGEIRALGGHPAGRPWRIGLENSQASGQINGTVELDARALATSAGSGTAFDKDGRHHHLLDPRSGKSSSRYLSLSVAAPSATTADALSTGLYHLTEDQLNAVIEKVPQVGVRATRANGSIYKVQWTKN